MHKMRVQTIDLGSSSLRLAFYEMDRENAHVVPLAESHTPLEPGDTSTARRLALAQIASSGAPDAIAHRIVYASNAYGGPALLTDALLVELAAAAETEPLHLRAQVELIRTLAEHYVHIPQILCFDSTFHRAMPAIAHRLPLPVSIAPIERYGYHGLSYEYVSSALGDMRGRTVIAHLGSGSSLCALLDGRPIDTTMGYSPLGGVMMATRPGDLDPGVMLYLMQHAHMNAEQLTDLFYRRSGMSAIANTTNDMRELVALAAHDTSAREAVDLFVYQLRKQLGSMVAVLGGLDTLVFTGGIGENSFQIREALCSKLRYLGVILSNDANGRNDTVISTHASAATVMVIRTNEALMLARHAYRMLSA